MEFVFATHMDEVLRAALEQDPLTAQPPVPPVPEEPKQPEIRA
jgi:ATP-dependent Lon protease